jgi:3-oxoacyl-[acyl-carrier protein] reductase
MNKVIVTGASRGLGRHFAMRLMDEGFDVVGLARRPDPGLPFETRACDVGNPEDVDRVFADLQRDRSVFALVNAAGVASMNLLVTMPPNTIQRIIATNLTGTILCCQAIAKALIRRGEGRIINFSSVAVALGLKGEAVYVASKAGVEGFSRSFAREMADHNVTVNVIAPGPIDTDLIAKVPRRMIQEIVSRQIMPRQAEPDDAWRIVDLLLKRESAMITGEVFHVGGI